MNKIRRILCILLSVALCMVSLAGCGDDEDKIETAASKQTALEKTKAAASDNESVSDEEEVEEPEEKPTWTILVYMCVSNLCIDADYDLTELASHDIPDNVQFVVQTGGVDHEKSEDIQWYGYDENKIQRYLFDSETVFEVVDEQPEANMSDEKTLEEFLDFSFENYPADHTMLVLWNHGGGPVGGVCFDSNYNGDSLKLSDLAEAFGNIEEKHAKTNDKLFDVIGFDACLMSSIDTAYTMSDYAEYMIGSEPIACGGYALWAFSEALNADPYLTGLELAEYECGAYEARNSGEGDENFCQVITDLSKMDELVEAYNKMGLECIEMLRDDPGFYTEFSRRIDDTYKFDAYGTADLGIFCDSISDILPSAKAVADLVYDSVVYMTTGETYDAASGLTFFYSRGNSDEELTSFFAQGASTAFKYFYSYGLTGEGPEGDNEYLEENGIDMEGFVPIKPLYSHTDWDGVAPKKTKNGNYKITLGPEADAVLSDISYVLYYLPEDGSTPINLGIDDNIECDWEKGVFTEVWDSSWGVIGDNVIFMEKEGRYDNILVFNSPILIDEIMYDLQIYYDYDTGEWSSGYALYHDPDCIYGSREYVELKPGDVITLLWADDDNGERTYSILDDVVVGDAEIFTYEPLEEGNYALAFMMKDCFGNVLYSDWAYFKR